MLLYIDVSRAVWSIVQTQREVIEQEDIANLTAPQQQPLSALGRDVDILHSNGPTCQFSA
jgi:hypothetical protein